MSENGPYPPELEALCDALINSDCDAAVKSRLFNILNNWEETKGFKLCESNKDLIKVLIELFLLNNTSVSKQVNLVLTECLEFEQLPEGPPTAIFDGPMLDLIRQKVMMSFKDYLEDTKDTDILEHWDLCVKLLGKHLHSGAGLINGLMTVVEKAFKLADGVVIEAAFRSWMVLMNNFALSPHILNTSKRVKLLMRPLQVNNAKTESTLRQKFTAWWHLVQLLGSNNYLHLETVILPFLKFCYGPKSDFINALDNPKIDPNSPATPLSPAKKHSSMEKPCLDALVQILASRPLSSSLPKSLLSGSLPSPAFTEDLAVMHADQIFHAVLEATSMVKPINRSEVVKVEAVWNGVGKLFSEAAAQDKVNTTGFQHYFSAVRCCVVQHRRTDRLHKLLLEIILSASQLPHKVLNNSSNFISDIKPANILLDLVLYPDFLNEASQLGEGYLEVFENLIKSLLNPPSSIQTIETVLKKMEVCGPNTTPSGLVTLSSMWQVMANMVSKMDSLADQGPGAMVTFNTALHLLKVPVQFLSSKGGDQKTMSAWSSLYQTLVEQAEMSVNHTTSFIASEMGERMESILQANNSPGQLAMHVKCNKSMMGVVDWASLARNLKGNLDPLAGFKRYMSPLGNMTNLLNHLKSCTEILVKSSRKDNLLLLTAQELLGSYQKLFSVSQQDLIRPVLRLISPSFSKVIAEDFMKSLLQVNQSVIGDIEKSVLSFCSMVKVKFNGDYSVEFLSEVEDVLLAVLDSPRRILKTKANEMWSVTFSTIPKEKLPEKISKVLKKSVSPGIRAQVSSGSEVSFPGSSSDSLTQQMTAEPAITVGLQKSAEPVKEKPAVVVMKPPVVKQKQARKSLSLRLEDEDSALFVPIKSTPKSKRLLTDHQKEVLTARHDDIPALYSELSRDDSIIKLPPQFASQDSMDASVSSADLWDKLKSKEPAKEADDSQSLLKASLKERKNKRFEVPSSPKSAGRSRRSISLKRGNSDEKKASKMDEAEVGTTEEIADKIFNKPEPEGLEKINQESDSVQIITLEKIENEGEDSDSPYPIDDLLGDDTEDDAMETDLIKAGTSDAPSSLVETSQSPQLPPVEVKVAKLSPKVVKADKYEAVIGDEVTAEVKKNLFDNGANTSVSSTDDDIIESSQDTFGTPTKSKRSKRRTIDRNERWEKLLDVSPVKRSPKKGVDDKRNKFGETPLHVAAKKGDVIKVKELLGQDANANIPDAAGWYPLHEVAVSGKDGAVAIMSLLIAHGATVDVFSGDGITPLHDAVMYGSKEQVATLVRAGADTELADKSGKTVSALAEESETQGMLQVILEEKETLRKNKNSEVVECEDTTVVRISPREIRPTALPEEFVDPEQISIEDMGCENMPTKSSSNIPSPEDDKCDETDNGGAEENVESDKNSVINEALNTSDIVLDNPAVVPEANNVTLTPLDGRGSVSPDANKENVQTNNASGEDTESDSEKGPAAKEDTLRMKSPFTALNQKQKKSMTSSGGTSRGAILLNLSRRVSIDTHVPPSPQTMSPKPENMKRPWMKYAPSPSHASPSASILKRPADDLDSSTEGSPVSAKRIRLDGSLPRRVHFNDNPVSDSVEIPRIPDGKHTRKKLLMSGYDQEMFISRVGGSSEGVDSDTQESCSMYTETPVSVSPNAVFPELCNSGENISTIIHNLANSTWAKVLEADLRQNKIITIGQLARMNSSQVRTLRGVKPDKEVTVKNALRAFWTKVKKEEGVVRMRAPVEEETTQEEEEEIKAALFARPSPSPTDMGEIDVAERESEEGKGDLESKVEIEVEVKNKEEIEVVKTMELGEPKTIVEETQSLEIIEEEEHKSPRKSPIKSPVKAGSWSLNIEDTPAKSTSEEAGGVIDMEESCTELTSEISSLPSLQAQSTTTPVQSISPESTAVKEEPSLDLTNMAMLLNSELDLATMSNNDLAMMYSNLGQYSSKVDQLRDKVAKTMFSRMDIS